MRKKTLREEFIEFLLLYKDLDQIRRESLIDYLLNQEGEEFETNG